MPSDSFAAEADRIRQRVMDTLLSAFSELSEGLLIVDRDARIVWMNEQYPRHLGFSDPAEAIGKPVEDVIPNSQMRSVVTSGQPIMLDIMEFGSESFVVMRLPVRDETGEIIGGVGVVIFDDPRQLAPIVSRFQNLRHELADTRRKLDEARRTKYTFASFVGASPVCVAVKDQARRAARSSSPVLILGETGTGKELLAQAIHSASPRAAAPFVAVNIAAIPETLLESEFFGVAPGAYTGADRKGRSGKFELAQGGTLFLDEIGDMPLALQARLLRVLAEGEVTPIGALRPRRVDLRVISATHRDLPAQVRAGTLREDLYYRLSAATFVLPPLREREDFDWLTQRLLDGRARLSPSASASLRARDWLGNLRELGNALAVAVALCEGGVIERADLPPEPGQTPAFDGEAEALRAVLARCGGNVSEAARQMRVDRTTVHRRMRRLGVAAH